MNRAPPPPLRTYSHLSDQKKVPNEYEIVSSRLLYYVERGFEIDVPVDPWYQKYQREARLRCQDWDRFRDPRETTYTGYTGLQADRERHLDALMASIESTDHDRRLPVEWRELQRGLLPPLRYFWHGFQMMAAYLGQMAPGGRITLVALFQAADEMRRVHRLAHRLGQLRHAHPGFAASALSDWQEAPVWQPLRRAIERGLVRYDWGEGFALLCLCGKPLLDQLLLQELAGLARARQDFFLGEILASLAEDTIWHRAWAGALVKLLQAESSDNGAALRGWVQTWLPPFREAAGALASTFWGPEAEGALARCDGSLSQWHRDLGLTEEKR